MSTLPVRYVHRATEIYYRIRARAFAPEMLRSGIDTSIETEALYRIVYRAGVPQGFRHVIEAEVEALLRGDIPRFWASAGSTEIYAGSGLILEGAFARPGLETVRRRLSNLGPARRAAEVRFIRASLHAARHREHQTATDAVAIGGRGGCGADEMFAAALDIGHAILAGAMHRADGGASWIGVAYRAEAAGPAAVVVNESLYEGTTGIGVFLAALYRVTGDRVWLEAAQGAFVDARRIAREAAADERIGSAIGLGLGGLGGLIYGLAIASDLLDDPSLRDDAGRLVPAIGASARAGRPDTDLIGGIAGAIPGLLALAEAGHGAEARDTALACARAVASHGDGSETSEDEGATGGYAHGKAGIVATLALLADGDVAVRRMIQNSLARCRAVHPHACAATARARSPVGWCKGPIGRAMAQLAIRSRLGDVDDEAIIAVDRAVDVACADDQALDQICCGLCGAADALLAAGATGRSGLTERAQRLAGAILERARRQGGHRLLAGLPPGFPSPGLFQGTAGIGYTLLRITRPHVLPSILLTEWRA
jgi:type 2 lantibiotic biosynthesis protein LanM